MIVSERPARVGVIVRTLNRPWFLQRALQDIIAQEFQDWTVHIVNDGGEAGPVDAAVADLPIGLQARFEVTHNAVSRGRSAAANQGVAGVSTPFIVLHDDDDLWHPEFLARTTDWLDSHPDHIGVVARTEIVYEASEAGAAFAEVERVPFWAAMTAVSFSDLLEINRFVPIAYLYRRVLHEDVGMYREDIHAAEDWEFNLRTSVRHRIGYLPDIALAYWMQRIGVDGDLGNSMFALRSEHEYFDNYIRDEALREFARDNGPGLVLHLDRLVRQVLPELVRDAVRDVVREEIIREFDRRPSELQRIVRRLRPGRRR